MGLVGARRKGSCPPDAEMRRMQAKTTRLRKVENAFHPSTHARASSVLQVCPQVRAILRRRRPEAESCSTR